MIRVETKHRSSDTLKYSHAYDEFGSLIGITAAAELSPRKWYLYPGKQVELKLAAINTSVQQTHWRSLQNQKVIIDGREYEYNYTHDSESYEHKQAKGLIIERGWFTYKGDKVFIKNQREEVRILDGKFRCDVLAQLLDGTPCAVEIIKTSDISEGKENRINELQLLTFKIYIDDKGNQITRKDKIIGNREIESINQRIQEGEGKLAEQKDRLEKVDKIGKNKAYEELSTFERKLYQRVRRDYGRKECEDFLFTAEREDFEIKIKGLEKECNEVQFGSSGEIERVEQSIKYIKRRIESTNKRISEYRERIQEIPAVAKTARIEPNKSIIKETIG
jgi:prefoldin subunit 5